MTTAQAQRTAAKHQPRRIALFGGSFDPIHNGHLAVARAADRRFNFDQIHFIPASRPPHKLKPHLAPFPHRFAMVALACAEHPHFVPSVAEAGDDFSGHAASLFRGYGALFSAYLSRAGRPHLLHHWRGCVSGHTDVEGIRSFAGSVRFHRCEPPGHPYRGAATGDSAGFDGDRGSTKRYRSGARVERGGASPPYFGLPARQRFQRSFRDRHPPPLPSRSRYSWTCLRTRRGIHSQTRPIPLNISTLPQTVRLAVEAAQNKKASGITVLDLREVGAFTDYFVICTGFSTPQVQAICTEIEEQLEQAREALAGAPRRARLGGMGAARFWRIHSSRIQRTSAALLRPGTAVAFGAEAGNSRRAGRSVGQSHSHQCSRGRNTTSRRSSLQMTHGAIAVDRRRPGVVRLSNWRRRSRRHPPLF